MNQDQQPLYLLDRESPADRRRRRQAQQQSSCCSCLLVMVSALIAIVVLWQPVAHWWQQRRQAPGGPEIVKSFPIELQADSSIYYRHNLVRLEIRPVDPYGNPVKLEEPPNIVVRRDDQVVITVAGVRRLTPTWQAQTKSYVCHWPIPWLAESGTYRAEARIEIANPGKWPWQLDLPSGEQKSNYQHGTAFCIAYTSFDIARRQRPEMPPGLCAVTWEADFPADTLVRRPDGTTGDWRAILDWCEFLGADTLWFRGAVTRRGCTDDEPFAELNLEAIPRLAAAAHDRGLKFGVWAVAYVTYPEKRSNSRGLPNYRWGQDISRSTGQISSVSYISLLDQRRLDDLADFFRRMQRNHNVDFVGLDYVRNKPAGGYEMTNRFTTEMPVDLPANWANYSRKQRWKYVATKVETEWNTATGRDFYEQWNWWRAHLNASNVEQIITKSGIEKPVWLFLLGWMHGAQHGQDAFMFTDAGVTLIAPMLYQVESFEHFDYLLEFWQDYAVPGQVNLAPGDQVDDYWHKKKRSTATGSRRPAAPEVLYTRMVRAHREMIEGGRTRGAFWHDISRAAVLGRRGPYPGSEWALAGAAAFSQIRQSWEVYPIKVHMAAPDSIPIGQPFTVRVTVENITEATVCDITIGLENTEHITPLSQGQRQVAKLGSGESHVVPFRARIAQADGQRANRYMVAARVGWAPGRFGQKVRAELPRTFVVIKYLNGT